MGCTHLLVPTDFSDLAGDALRCAMEEATVRQARVTLLHVLSSQVGTDVFYVTGSPEPPPQGSLDPVVAGGRLGASPAAPPMLLRADHHEATLAQLRDLIPAEFRGTWDVAIAIGHAAESIVQIARERNVDLIVMGTHGRTGFRHAVLGSVAEKVVRLAPCPVLTVPSRIACTGSRRPAPQGTSR